MWHDHPFSQRNKTLKRAVGLNIGGDGGGGLDKIWKKGEYAINGVCIKYGGGEEPSVSSEHKRAVLIKGCSDSLEISLKILEKEFIFSKVAGYRKPATLQKMR